MRRQYVAIIILIISALAFFILVIPKINIALFFETMKNIDSGLFILALMALTISNLLASLRWSRILKEAHVNVSSRFYNAFGQFCFGQLAGIVVPSRVGNYTKIPLIRQLDSVTYELGLAAVNAETVLDLVYICGAGLASILLMSDLFSSRPGYSLILVVMIIIFGFGIFFVLYKITSLEKTGKYLEDVSQDSTRTQLTRIPAMVLSKIIGLVLSTRNLLSSRIAVTELGILTIFTQIFGVLGLYCIILSVHANIPPMQVFAILSITYIIGIISLIPGGFGAADLSLIALLDQAGLSASVATNIALLWRIAMYLPILILVMIWYIRQKLASTDLYPPHQ